jgi:outer membrane protein assembly factor BamC
LVKKSTHAAAVAALCLALAACSGGTSNSRIDYKEAESLSELDVPPDLITPANTGVDEIPQVGAGEAGSSTAGAGGIQVLPRSKGIEIKHDGTKRWLLIDQNANRLWPRLRAFWPTIGLELTVDEPKLGIMETAWAENRVDAPGGAFSGVFKMFKNAYSADTRDKYRLRLEPREDGKAELFLTHYGIKEVIASRSDEIIETAWVVRPSDPELANEVMNRLVLFLGGDKAVAKAVVAKSPAASTVAPVAAPRARLEGDMLVLDEGFSRSWRLTGIALDRLGLVVEDRNRSAGVYYVDKVDLLEDAGVKSQGVFGGLFSSEEAASKQVRRQILLRGDEQQTRISVLDSEGNPDHSDTARNILKRLQEALK